MVRSFSWSCNLCGSIPCSVVVLQYFRCRHYCALVLYSTRFASNFFHEAVPWIRVLEYPSKYVHIKYVICVHCSKTLLLTACVQLYRDRWDCFFNSSWLDVHSSCIPFSAHQRNNNWYIRSSAWSSLDFVNEVIFKKGHFQVTSDSMFTSFLREKYQVGNTF